MNSEDKILIKKLILGKEDAFDEIFRKYFRQLVLFSIKIVKSKDSAEEIVQDLFVTLWSKKEKLQLKVSVKAYLYRAVYNNSVRYYKNQQQFVNSNIELSESISENYIDILEQAEIEDRIYETIEQLPEKCKEIFKLKRFDELKNKEIANKLQISIKTVETQMTRALKFLTANLKDLVSIIIGLLIN